jgi:drug/metabolite transporter superfamily protein YnfA
MPYTTVYLRGSDKFLAYWRDLGLATLGAVCIIGGGVRFWAWIKEHRTWALATWIGVCTIVLFRKSLRTCRTLAHLAGTGSIVLT